jgi:hypothetical protein
LEERFWQAKLKEGKVALSKEQASIRSEAISVQHGVIGWDKVIDVCDVLAGKAKAAATTNKSFYTRVKDIVDLALAKKCYDLSTRHGKGYELRIEARENWWVPGGRTQTW